MKKGKAEHLSDFHTAIEEGAQDWVPDFLMFSLVFLIFVELLGADNIVEWLRTQAVRFLAVREGSDNIWKGKNWNGVGLELKVLVWTHINVYIATHKYKNEYMFTFLFTHVCSS